VLHSLHLACSCPRGAGKAEKEQEEEHKNEEPQLAPANDANVWGLYDGNNKLLLAVDDGAASGGSGGLGSGQEATGEVLGQTLTIRVAAGGSSLEVSRRVVRDNKAERCKGKLASRENEAARREEEVKALEVQMLGVMKKIQERSKDGRYDNPDLLQEMAQLAAVQGQHAARLEELASRDEPCPVSYEERRAEGVCGSATGPAVLGAVLGGQGCVLGVPARRGEGAAGGRGGEGG
jgi:hypothetical protein